MIYSTLFDWSQSLYGALGAGVKLEPGVSTVLIFGGSTTGLGIELSAALLFEHNIRVINVDTVDLEVILNVTEAVQLSKHYTFVQCDDFADTGSVVHAMREVIDLQMPINFFINNVQEGFESMFDGRADSEHGEKAVSHLRKCVNANLTNVMIATKTFLESIIPQTVRISKGKISEFYIVNISTVLSLQLPDFARHFTSSKAALNQFHDSLTSELNIRGGHTSVKTLLAYLPNTCSGENWEAMLTELADLLVQNLIDGKQGDTLLKCRRDISNKDKARTSVLYRLGKFQHNWL